MLWQHISEPSKATDGIVGCPVCGLLQRVAACHGKDLAYCIRCQTPLVHCAGKSFDVALCSSVATFLFVLPTLFLPFLTTYMFGTTRTSILPSSAAVLWREGFPLLAIVVALFLFVFPLVRFAALSAVLGAIRIGRRPSWLGPVFRLANELQTWAMLDVFFLGAAITYLRLRVSIHVTIEKGALCFVAAAVLSLVARAALDKRLVWRLIAPDTQSYARGGEPTVCTSCGLVAAAGSQGRLCRRCAARLHDRRPEGTARAIAMLVTASLLYLPANVYPIAMIPIDFKPTSYTVIGGIIDLSRSHLIGLALLVFTASFAIPLLKMVGLAWCAVSSLRHSTKHLIGKSHVYRVIEEIGRWSMVDPFSIACFVPVMHFNDFVDGRAEPAVTPFAAVVILTTLAVREFDPRRMWDRVAA
jgi:paraquat-inducible protein A